MRASQGLAAYRPAYEPGPATMVTPRARPSPLPTPRAPFPLPTRRSASLVASGAAAASVARALPTQPQPQAAYGAGSPGRRAKPMATPTVAASVAASLAQDSPTLFKRRPPAPGRQQAGNEPGQACGALTRRSLMAQAAAGRPGLAAQASGLLTRRSLAQRQAGHAGAPYQAPMGLPAPQRRTGEQRTGQLTLRRSLASVGLIPKPGPAQSISGAAQAAAHACEPPRAPRPTPRRRDASAGGHASGTAGARTHRALASGRAPAPPLSMPCRGELITTRPSLVALGTPRGIAGRARASPGFVPAPTRAPALSLQGSLTVRSAAVGPQAHTQPSEEDEPVAQEEGSWGRQASVGVDAEAAGPAARLAALGQATGLLPAQVAAHEQFEGVCNRYFSKAAVTGRLIACTEVACTAMQLQSKPCQSVFVAGCALCAVPGRYTLQGLWGS